MGISERGVDGLVASLRKEIWEDKYTTLKVGVPAFAYTVSNNCLFLSTVYIDASTAQILYQAKLLTTAGFSVMLLGAVLTKTKWICLVVLTAGAMAIKMNASAMSGSLYASNPLLGLVIIAFGCLCSSSAGVWFEKMLKGSSTSLWVRNVQLGVFSIIVGLFGSFMADGEKIRQGGFLQGYDGLA